MGTLLDAINSVIQSDGMLPVANEDARHPAVYLAKSILESENKKVQKRGYWFNRQYSTLTPTVDGYIIVDSSALVVDCVSKDYTCAVRDGKLYDVENTTFVFDQDAEVPVEYILLIDIEQIPQAAYDYVVARATRKFLVNSSDEKAKIDDAKVDEYEARVGLATAELEVLDPNARYSPQVQKFMGPMATSNYRFGGGGWAQ